MTATALQRADAWRELRTHDLTSPTSLIPLLLELRRRQRRKDGQPSSIAIR
jgi:hypothetical protein